jgi:hypothetical protein
MKNCCACGRKIQDTPIDTWGQWCVPCQTRIKLETPWYSPGMRQAEQMKAEADWKLKHGPKPIIGVAKCPFCGGDAKLATAELGPYLIECRCGATGARSNTPEGAALMWNGRVGSPT